MKVLITIEVDGDRDDAETVRSAIHESIRHGLSLAPFATSIESKVVPSPHDLEEEEPS